MNDRLQRIAWEMGVALHCMTPYQAEMLLAKANEMAAGTLQLRMRKSLADLHGVPPDSITIRGKHYAVFREMEDGAITTEYYSIQT